MLQLAGSLAKNLENPVVLFFALILDILIGEPPELVHPVVWFGKLILVFERLNRGSQLRRFFAGILVTVCIAMFAFALSLLPRLLPFPVSFALSVYLTKTSFSIRAMVEHVNRIVSSDFDPSDVQMVVSRKVGDLEYWMRCSAVIESIAENFVDSVLSPLFYYALFGLGGALVYRAVNTCDAMIGYRNERYIWFGKFAARLDDLMNYLPARLSVVLTALVSDFRALKALKEKIQGKVNGCSMIAYAYALNLRLEKPGYYVLNEGGNLPDRDDVLRAKKLFLKQTSVTIFLIFMYYLILRPWFGKIKIKF